MNKTSKIIIGIIVIATIVAVGYAFYKEQNKPILNEPIKIGAVLSLSGYAAGYGEYAQKAINLAVKEINDSGGMNNRKVEMVFEDDKTDAKDSVSAFQKLVSVDNVDGVIGGLFDFTAQPLMPLADQNDITFISPINFRIEGSFEPGANTFVMMPEFKKVIEPLRVYIEDQNIKILGTVRFASPMGDEISRILFGIMKERGQKEAIDEKYNEIGGNDFRTTILKLKSKNVDGVFMDMIDSDMNTFLRRAKEAGLNAKMITHPIALDMVNNPQVDRSLIDNLFFVNWEAQPEGFSKRFEKEYGILPAKSADRNYDGLYVLATAIANSSDKHGVNEYIENNTFKTINGEIKFTNQHLVENLPIKLQIIKDGKILDYVRN